MKTLNELEFRHVREGSQQNGKTDIRIFGTGIGRIWGRKRGGFFFREKSIVEQHAIQEKKLSNDF